MMLPAVRIVLCAASFLACASVGAEVGADVAALGARPPQPSDPDFSRIEHRYLEPGWIVTGGKKRSSWVTGVGDITTDFLIGFGSKEEGTDGGGIPRKILNVQSNGGQQNRDGFVFQVTRGFALVTGQGPIVAGRRVRAASDGTQFAVECAEIKVPKMGGGEDTVQVDRVYLLYGTAGKPLQVEVYADEGQSAPPLATATLSQPGQYYELRHDTPPDQLSTQPSGTISGKEVTGSPARSQLVYFAAQMFLLLNEPILSAPKSQPTANLVATGADFDAVFKARENEPVRVGTPMGRFLQQFPPEQFFRDRQGLDRDDRRRDPRGLPPDVRTRGSEWMR